MIWKIRAGTSGRYWNSWNNNNIISVGWDVGNLKDLDWDETKTRIEKEYPDKNTSMVTGKIRSFAGVRETDDDNISTGDYIVVLGEGTVLGVAKVGEYKYVPEGIPERDSHTYQRDVNYLFKGPVRVRDLPSCYHQGGEYSLHLPSTLMKFPSANEEIIENLIEELSNAEPVESNSNFFMDFSETSLQEYIENNYDELGENITEFEREYSTAVGDADFKCVTKNGNILVSLMNILHVLILKE